MDERDEPGQAASQTDAAENGAADAEDAAARELEAYRREKQDTGRRMAQRARASREPDWQASDHLDPERDSHRPSRSGAARDAEGQARTGIIDQTVTDDGNTARE